MKLDNLDLIVSDVPRAVAFFKDVLGIRARVEGERFAELDTSPVTIMLSPDAMVSTNPARGVILHFQVDDVSAAVERARSSGGKVLMEPTRTDWGWESAMVAGPEEIVVDLYRPLDSASKAQ